MSRSLSYRMFARWATFSYQYAVWVILIALLVVVLSVVYTSRNLGVQTDTADMLSEDIPFRVNYNRYAAAFPQYDDSMLLVLNAPTPEQVHTATHLLTTQLQDDTAHFHDVYYPGGDEFFARNGLLYEEIPELERIIDRLAAAQPLVARIANDPTLYTFASVLTEAINELHSGRKLELEPVLNSVSATLNARLAGTPRALSWQALFSDETQKDTYQELVLVQPKLDYTQLFAAEQSIAAIRSAANDIGLANNSVEGVRITGEAALAYDDLNSAMRGTQNAGLLALVMATVILFLALRTAGAVLTVLVSLILGLLLTAAFATAAVGHLNLISIAFAVLYIGLGIDYAIHFLLRHQELRECNQSVPDTLYIVSGDMGRALLICALTTAIGFYAFIPTNYQGIAELGLISGTGMLISLLVTLTLVPAMQRFFPSRPKKPTNTVRPLSMLLELPQWAHKWSHKFVYMITTMALLASMLALPQIKFDYNLLNLSDPNAESVQTFRELLAEAGNSPWYIAVLTEDPQETKNIAGRLNDLAEVDEVVSIFDLVPAEQQEKMLLIEEMALTLGPTMFSTAMEEKGSQSIIKQRVALEALNNALDRFIAEKPDHAASVSASELRSSLTSLLTRLNKINKGEEKDNNAEQLLQAVSNDLLGLLPGSIKSLQTSLEAQPFTRQSLPASLRTQWHSQNGAYQIAVFPAENINDNDALRRFVRAVQQVAPDATGAPVISLEAGEAVVDAFIQAFSLAFVGVVLALLVLLRNVKSTLLVLVPLLLAALFTGACTVLLNIPFNFANIIALPLLLGIGIDCSMHMVHRSQNPAAGTYKKLLHTSTVRAVFYSVLTTLMGFGSLVFSSHQGTASLGLLLAVGVLLTLVCVLIILPVLLQSFGQGKK